MRRRGFITGLGSIAAAWSFAGHGQQTERVRRVGVLLGFPENDPFTQRIVSAFAQALRRLGWVEGKNIVIDYRFAAGDPTLFKPYAAELVGLAPDAILASPGPAVAVLRELTHTIPIVGVLLGDPVGLGYVQSFSRPGGNITGFTSYEPPMMGKWLQLLKDIAPSVTHVAVIYNPDTSNPGTASVPLAARGIEAAAPSFGVTVTQLRCTTTRRSSKPSPPRHTRRAAASSLCLTFLTLLIKTRSSPRQPVTVCPCSVRASFGPKPAP